MMDFQPGPLADASVENDTLTFPRELPHPPGRVWRALTDPAELAEWAPFDPDRNLGATGPATLSMEGEPTAANVHRVDANRLLEYTWDTDVLRWELEPVAAGTRLTLRHTVADPAWITKVAAGWHICIDVLARFLDGQPVGRIAGEEAKQYGWARLNAEYADRLGLAP